MERATISLFDNVVFGAPKMVFTLVGTGSGMVVLILWGYAWCILNLRNMVETFGVVLGPIAQALDLVIRVIIDAVKGLIAFVSFGFAHEKFIPITLQDQTGETLGNMSKTKEMCHAYSNPAYGIGEIVGLTTRHSICPVLRYTYPSPTLRRFMNFFLRWTSVDPNPDDGNCQVTFKGVYCTFIYSDALAWVAIGVVLVGVGIMSFNVHEILFDLLDYVLFVPHAIVWAYERVTRGHRNSFRQHLQKYLYSARVTNRNRIYDHVPKYLPPSHR